MHRRTSSTRVTGPRFAALAVAAATALGFVVLSTAVQADSEGRLATAELVERAIRTPFSDVGIEPTSASLAFWSARVAEQPHDYVSRTRLASTVIAQARETGDLSLYTRAEDILRSALAINPTDEGSLLALAAARAANHDFATSMVLAQQVLSRNPSSQVARATIADDNFELGNYREAGQQVADLAAELGDSPAISVRRAKLAAIHGHNDRAIRHAAHALLGATPLDLKPSEAAFYRFQLAHFLTQAGKLSLALAAVDAGLRIAPDHLASLELRAQLLVSLRRLPQAAALYEQLVASTPAADLLGDLAKVYRALGRATEADVMAERGLELGYEALQLYPAERRHLASFFADFDPPAALLAAKADFETRRDIGAYDALAWAYYVNGDHVSAARYIGGALAQGTQDATLLYHAGMIARAEGHPRRAVRLLTAALALNPHFDLQHTRIARATLQALQHRIGS